LTMRVFAGEGIGGTLLDLRTINPPSNFAGYYDVDFSNLTLTPGQKYSATLGATSDRFVSDSTGPSAPNYTGGVAIVSNVVRPDVTDKAFRVIPVPEPASAGLLMAGGAVAMWRRRVPAST
jgi:hypothetical protein